MNIFQWKQFTRNLVAYAKTLGSDRPWSIGLERYTLVRYLAEGPSMRTKSVIVITIRSTINVFPLYCFPSW